MKVLHLLAAGDFGGIEVLVKSIIQYSNEDNRICFLFNEGMIYEELKRTYGTNVIISLMKNNVFEKIKILKKYCLREKIQVVILHNQGMKPNIIYNVLCKELKKKNVKFVMYVHSAYDKYYNPYKNNVIRILYEKVIKKTMKDSNLIIYISKKVEETFHNHFKKAINKNETVIYNGIDNKFFKNIKLKEEHRKTIKIVYVGRLSKEKGVDILIDALNFIVNKSKIKSIQLKIVGDGPERNNLETKVIENNLSDFVKFLGRKRNVIEYLDDADIFVYPSTWEEGFGISVVEAMSRGCIPITFYKGGLPEIIKNGINGFLIKDVNAIALAEGILRTVDLLKSGEANKVIEKAKNDATKYSINNTINSINYKLKEVLSN